MGGNRGDNSFPMRAFVSEAAAVACAAACRVHRDSEPVSVQFPNEDSMWDEDDRARFEVHALTHAAWADTHPMGIDTIAFDNYWTVAVDVVDGVISARIAAEGCEP